jgi:hypothetical protein
MASMILSPATRYFTRRWRGEVPPSVLLWRDMIAVGTVINLVATFAALVLISQGVPLYLAVALHFAPLPFNVFLFAALWRTPRTSTLSTGIGLAWVAVMAVA